MVHVPGCFLMNKIMVLTTSLGGIDGVAQYVPQSVKYDFYKYDEPLRYNSMTPRLQAKIPKFFGWKLKPDYDYYLWLDGNLSLADSDSLKYFHDAIQDYDVVVLKHPYRNTIWWEYRYNWRGLHNNAPSNYLRKRYVNELLDEQINVIKDDKDYVDDYLVLGGVFMYRNTPEVHRMLKEWFYHVSRYCVMDQLSWAYVFKKSGLRVNVLPDIYNDCKWLKVEKHA